MRETENRVAENGVAENGVAEDRVALRFVALGAILALIAVGVGAFGAHGLRARVEPGMLAVFETGVRYQMYHALGLLAVGGACAWRGSRLAVAAGVCFVAGILLFSGSLYLLVLTGVRGLGAITPFGGVAFLAGWALLAAWALRSPAGPAPLVSTRDPVASPGRTPRT